MVSLPEKFFKERDLKVLDESRVNAEQATAQDWFEAVERTVGALPIYSHDNMGMPSDASTNRATTPEGDGVWFFRGQKDVSFAFHSSLYRRLLNAEKEGVSPRTPKDHEKAMVNAELALLSKAKKMELDEG